jgi:hypothetical protein
MKELRQLNDMLEKAESEITALAMLNLFDCT